MQPLTPDEKEMILKMLADDVRAARRAAAPAVVVIVIERGGFFGEVNRLCRQLAGVAKKLFRRDCPPAQHAATDKQDDRDRVG